MPTFTQTTFLDAVRKAAPGQAIIYHTGSLMYDRMAGPNFLTTNGVAIAAWKAFEAKWVTLVQRFTGEQFKYDYIAIRRAVTIPREPR
jgi:hypothetical protein